MITPGLISSLQTLDEILDSGNTKEARLYLSSVIKAVQAAQEHEVQREALLGARVLLNLILVTSSAETEADSPEEKAFNDEVRRIQLLIARALSLKGMLQ